MTITAKVKDIMTFPVITVDPDDTMDRVKRVFDHHSIHHIPVVKNNKVVGIITKSDYFKVLHGFTLFKAKKSEEYNNAVMRSLLVGEVMTKQIATLHPNDSLQTAAGYFRENLFHAIPIVDDKGGLMGILTTYDMLNFAFKEESINLN